jgi:hypothetical protein
MNEEPATQSIIDDESLIRTVAFLAEEAQRYGDDRVLSLLREGIKLLTNPDLIATLLLRYKSLMESDSKDSSRSRQSVYSPEPNWE